MLKLISPAFPDNGELPAAFTAEGENVSPPLSIQDVPREAKSLALIAIDPDAPDPEDPKMTFDHWVLYNLPPDVKGLPADAANGRLPDDVVVGKNSWGERGYGGPNPPIGRHRYFFQLYALDTRLPELSNPTREQVEREMEGHIVARTSLMGTYEKARR